MLLLNEVSLPACCPCRALVEVAFPLKHETRGTVVLNSGLRQTFSGVMFVEKCITEGHSVLAIM